MLFTYQATTQEGQASNGTIDTATADTAIASLQRRGLIVVSIASAEKRSFFGQRLVLFSGVSQNEIVVLSRQFATLFEARVSILDALKLLASESENSVLQEVLTAMVDDIQSGTTISGAMSKHPKVFSSFYLNMIKAGEESGKLPESFSYLADYLERQYELTSRVRNALVYPAFIIVSFIGVMIVMLVVVVPQLSTLFAETGAALPFTTKLILGISSIFINFGVYLAVLFIFIVLFCIRYSRSTAGRFAVSQLKITLPCFGNLYRKLYLSRIADNMDTMLSSGISMVRAIEITADVVGNDVYRAILREAMEAVRTGSSFSDALSKYPEIPRIIVQMSKIGEETGKLGYVLKTIARFYKRETTNAVDTMVTLIEPTMIVVLGIGVGFLLTAIIGPIYSITSSI